MKNYLLILSMIICNAYGQIPNNKTLEGNSKFKNTYIHPHNLDMRDTIFTNATDTILLIYDNQRKKEIVENSIYVYNGRVWNDNEGRKRDTIKVLLLVCDTAWWTGNKINALGEQFGQVFWRYGYSVREIHNEAEGTIDWGFDHQRPAEDYGVHIYYLDKNKLPLSKNIIVWQSKELQ